MIFIDWGTTHARAWCGDERRDGPGMRAVKDWPTTFRELTRGWEGDALICGMAGARDAAAWSRLHDLVPASLAPAGWAHVRPVGPHIAPPPRSAPTS